MNKIFYGFILAIFSQTVFGAALAISDPWIREAPPSSKNLAGYVELTNKSTSPIQLHSASSPLFSKVELHVTRFENGMMRMQELSELTIAPGETMIFEPGGKHFMLILPSSPIKEGLIVPLNLKQINGDDIQIEFMVRK